MAYFKFDIAPNKVLAFQNFNWSQFISISSTKIKIASFIYDPNDVDN